jgi:two-component system sensor histidine kinase/response regulator
MSTPPFPTQTPPRSRVLVVDDIPKNLQVVGTMLRNAGYAIMPASSGAEALEGVRVQVPDLILLDLMMPEMDGLEVCRRLKADPLTQAVPVIFLTASNEMEHLVQGFDVGAVDYVTKPFNPPELLARVRTHLELKHARDTIVRYGQELSRLNEEKNEFMGIAAHDLRNPLGAIKGYAEMMREEPSMDQRERDELLGRIHDATTRMADMVQNLLDANRIERGEMLLNLTSTRLGPILGSVIEAQLPRASGKRQAIHLESDPSASAVLVDTNVTVQVLENLVSNAVKYSPPGRDIFVRLKPHVHGARVEVQDEGPGLSAEDQKKLFGRFARLSAKPTGGEHSTGLGLSIVKKMVEAMNGKVWCESEPGKGATFIVEFPAAGG